MGDEAEGPFGPEYPKINSVYQRDEKGRFLVGKWAEPEFEYLADVPWRWTEKIDGTNLRLHWNPEPHAGEPGNVTLGGRTDNADMPTFLVAALAPLNDPGLFHSVFGDEPATVYGEGYGAKIQKGGGDYRPDQGMIVFDVKVGDWWLKLDAVADVAVALGLPMVPDFGIWTLREAVSMVRLGGHAESAAAQKPRPIEGLVGEPLVQLFGRDGHRILSKVKLRDFKPGRFIDPEVDWPAAAAAPEEVRHAAQAPA